MGRPYALSNFLERFSKFCPLSLADKSWDNVGLILEARSLKEPKEYKILLTIDLTEEVYEEACNGGFQMIFSYHPPWFRGEKNLTMDEDRGPMRVVSLCASSGISIFSPHSALDAVSLGLNDYIAKIMFGDNISSIKAIIPTDLQDSLVGQGRYVLLKCPITLDEMSKRWSLVSNTSVHRFATSANCSTTISSVGICVGSGSGLLSKLPKLCDAFFTGEMSHHDILRCTKALEMSILLTEHTNCERVYLGGFLKDHLENILSTSTIPYQISLSSSDKDPIEFFINKNK